MHQTEIMFKVFKKLKNKILKINLSPAHERKYSSDGTASPMVIKLEQLESLVESGAPFAHPVGNGIPPFPQISFENSSPNGNYAANLFPQSFPSIAPGQLAQINQVRQLCIMSHN